jgi:hypothetical protein
VKKGISEKKMEQIRELDEGEGDDSPEEGINQMVIILGRIYSSN